MHVSLQAWEFMTGHLSTYGHNYKAFINSRQHNQIATVNNNQIHFSSYLNYIITLLYYIIIYKNYHKKIFTQDIFFLNQRIP